MTQKEATPAEIALETSYKKLKQSVTFFTVLIFAVMIELKLVLDKYIALW